MEVHSSLRRGFALSEQNVVDALAEAAVAGVTSGMIVGLGTGRAAKRGIRALADRVREENLDIKCVCTSVGSEKLATELALNVVDFSMIERVDYLFDGADEIDAELRMIKGGGGALTREKIIAHAADQRIYMVTHDKVSERLGSDTSLPVAVMAFGLSAIRGEIRTLGLNGVVRRTLDGQLFITDNANLILDCTLETHHDLEQVAAGLNDIPGVVAHGLFLYEADEILIEQEDGSVQRKTREND